MFVPLKDENPTQKRPILTISLIAANVIIFVLTVVSGSFANFIKTYGMIPKDIVHGRNFYTILTSMFLHGSIPHILFNGWYLWIFGDNIEDHFGRPQFVLIYFGSGIAASLAHVLFYPNSTSVTVGASGAIAGIMGAYFIKYPRAKVLTLFFIFLFFTIIKVPSFLFLGVWIFLQILTASITTVQGIEVTTAYWAHIGGFIVGVLLAIVFSGKEPAPIKDRIYAEDFSLGGYLILMRKSIAKYLNKIYLIFNNASNP